MDDLVAAGVDAIMVSAVDPKTSTEALNRVGGQVPLFTTDSDAPDSNRIAYIGSSNTDAGKQAGEIMLKAMPDGGKCMGFVGLPGADNARERIEGVQEAIKGSKVELVDVRGDDIDQTRAKRNVEDTLAANPDINCMVGFYSYNTPRIYEVLKEAGQLGEIKVIAFDEDPITLGGVREGTIAGTVVQQPYEWGYQGMMLMAKYLEGDKSVIPANELIIVPTKIIDKANVDAFEAELDRAHQGLTPDAGRAAGDRAGPAGLDGAKPLLELSGITKTYPGVVALGGVDLAVRPRRGARPDRRERRRQVDADEDPGRRHPRRPTGTIRIDGAERDGLTVGEAIAAGIAFVHQELNLFDNLDVAANVFIGREPRWGGPLRLIDRPALRAQVRPILRPARASISARTRRWPSCRWRSCSWSRSPRRCRSTRGSSSWTSRPRA